MDRAVGPSRSPWAWRIDGTLLGVLVVGTAAARWIDRERFFWGWDSFLFALALEHYDINDARPHPPGFPVFVGIGKVLHWATGDAHSALIILSILSSALGVGLLYGFVHRIATRRAATVAALFLGVAPLAHFHGVLTLSYVTEIPMSVGLAWAAWAARADERPRTLIVLGALASAAVGLRQSLLFTLAPLVLYGVVVLPTTKRILWRRAAWVSGAAVAATLVWAVPMLLATGPRRWWLLSSDQSEIVFYRTFFNGGTAAVAEHAGRILTYLQHEIWVGGLVAAVAALSWAVVRWPVPSLAHDRRLGLLAAWLLPGLAFNLLVYSGYWIEHNGYVVVLLPGLYAGFAIAADASLRHVEGLPRLLRLPRTTSAATLLLLLLPAPLLAVEAHAEVARLVPARDADTRQWLAFANEAPENGTAFLTDSHFSWLRLRWYLPDHVVWLCATGRDEQGTPTVGVIEARHHDGDTPFYDAVRHFPDLPRHPIPSSVERVVLFDGRDNVLQPATSLETATLSTGWQYKFFRPDPSRGSLEDYLRPLDLR